MRLIPTRRSSRFVLGSGALLLAVSLYAFGTTFSSLEGRVTGGQKVTTGRGSLHTMQEFGTSVRRARQAWKSMRAKIRTATADTPRTETMRTNSQELAFRSAQLTEQHLEISYTLPSPECVSLWLTGAANQKFQRVTVICGIPCSMAIGDLTARLLLTSVQPALTEGQLIKLCTNNTLQCTEPIAIAKGNALSHSAADAAITIHSAAIVKSSILSIIYSKSAGCANVVRWNGIGDSKQVTFQSTAISCDAVNHENAEISMLGMQPVLGPNQWIHLCMENSETICSNVMQIR